VTNSSEPGSEVREVRLGATRAEGGTREVSYVIGASGISRSWGTGRIGSSWRLRSVTTPGSRRPWSATMWRPRK